MRGKKGSEGGILEETRLLSVQMLFIHAYPMGSQGTCLIAPYVAVVCGHVASNQRSLFDAHTVPRTFESSFLALTLSILRDVGGEVCRLANEQRESFEGRFAIHPSFPQAVSMGH
jgi:hypothetical protein